MMMRKVLAYLNMSIYFALRHLRASLPRAKIIKGWYLWSNCQIKQNVFGLHLNPTFASHIETLVSDVWCLNVEATMLWGRDCNRGGETATTRWDKPTCRLFCKSSNFFQVVLIVTTLLFLGFHAPRVNIVLGRDDSNDQDDVMWLVVIIQVMMSGYEAASIQAAVLCRYELQVAAKVAGIT